MNLPKSFAFCLLSVGVYGTSAVTNVRAADHGRLVFAIDLIRHGDRTPLEDIPTAPNKRPEGPGQLTANGIQQECQLGAKLRTIYINECHLLPSNYVSGTIYVRSTDSDRTLMSAESVLMGLYPPGTGPALSSTGQFSAPCGIQPIPIHTVPRDTDALLIPDYDLNKYNKLVARYVFSTLEWKEKSTELKPKFDQWSQATGITITNLSQLKYIGDTVYIDRVHQVPMPQELAENAQMIVDAGRWVFVQGYKPREIGRITGSALLNAIADYLQQASEGKSPLKYVLFSAHDSTQLSLLSAMGSPLTDTPPYASDLRFSLFETDRHVFHIEVSFNDRPVIIPKFGGSSCSLAQFKTFAKRQ